MKTRAVLFDLDGTLVDSLPLIVRTYRQVFKEMDLAWGNGAVVKMIGLPLRKIGEHFAGENSELFEKLYQTFYHRDHDQYTRLFPGTLSMLDQLKGRGLRLGVVTSKGKPGTERTLAFTGLRDLLEVVVTAHDVLKHKPEPEPLLKALDSLGAGAAEAIYVGDSHFDILTGRNAGTRTLGVTWGLGSREELEPLRPDGLLDHWDELPRYL